MSFPWFGGVRSPRGEHNGKGEPVPGGVNGKYLCSFSGHDVLDADEGPFNRPDDDVTSLRNYLQSYGVFLSLGMKDGTPAPAFFVEGTHQKTERPRHDRAAPASSPGPCRGSRLSRTAKRSNGAAL